MAGNIGVGYRKLSDSKTSMTGANVFFDYDEKGNARASVGIELRSSAFDALANYYSAISGGKTVGDYTERTLDGYDINVKKSSNKEKVNTYNHYQVRFLSKNKKKD